MNKDKCLYLTFQPISKADGVSKKVFAQKEALNNIQLETSIIYPIANENYEYSYYHNDQLIIKNINRSKLIFPSIYNNSFYNILFNKIIENNITFIYIRYGLNASPSFIKFLKKCKGKNIIIFLEIATYPYDGEITTLRLLPGKIIEKIYRKKLYKYIDRIITYSDDKLIYNTKTINISNAAPDNLPLKTDNKIIDNHINLLVVANIAFWHGIDRIIEGINNYYKTKPQYKVYLNIVGEATNNLEAQKLKHLVQQYQLEQYVNFCGAMDGEKLDYLFEKSNLAIGCLGCHRKNITKVKSLKNVEYAIRGIPFIYSEINVDFDNAYYVHKVPANDTPIDITSLCKFILNQKFEPQIIKQTVEHLTWRYQMNIIYKEYLNLK